MTTKIVFEDKQTGPIQLEYLEAGSSFLWNDKIYLKLKCGTTVRIKGGGSFSSFELSTLKPSTFVEPLNAEFTFTRK